MTSPLKPSPSKPALSDSLKDLICAHIDEHGPMPFREYMHWALYQPQYGYYRNGLPKFGPQGDFTTAPEISPLFGYCLANQCQQILSLGTIDTILEFGAGSGQLACDILTRLDALNSLPQHYWILEPCQELRQRQHHCLQQAHPALVDRVHWLSELPEAKVNAIVIANEVLDAMPVTKFVIDNQQLYEMSVDHSDQQLQWINTPATAALNEQVAALKLQPDTPRYESEFNPWLASWLKSLSRCLNQGTVLLIDYGFSQQEYYHSCRHTGTIMCHFEHRAHSNPLIYPGIQDITAHVNFTAVAAHGCESGFELAGYTHQAAFLSNCGLLKLREHTDAAKQYTQAQQIKMLTLPSEMGELFKVISLNKNMPLDLLGFESFDLSFRL